MINRNKSLFWVIQHWFTYTKKRNLWLYVGCCVERELIHSLYVSFCVYVDKWMSPKDLRKLITINQIIDQVIYVLIAQNFVPDHLSRNYSAVNSVIFDTTTFYANCINYIKLSDDQLSDEYCKSILIDQVNLKRISAIHHFQ